MSPVFPARRRAEEFAAAGRRAPRPRAADAARVRRARSTVVGDACGTPRRPQPRPEFVGRPARAADGGGRDRTRGAPPADRAGCTAPRRRSPRASAASPPRSAGSPSSAPPRRGDRRPEQPCRATRSTRSSAPSRTPTPALQLGDAEKGPTLLGQRRRPARRGRGAPERARATPSARCRHTLDDFADQAPRPPTCCSPTTQQPGDQDSIDAAARLRPSSMDRLSSLEPTVPGQARDALVRAAQVLVAVDAAAHRPAPTAAAASPACRRSSRPARRPPAGHRRPRPPAAPRPARTPPRRSRRSTSTRAPRRCRRLGDQSLPPGSVLGSGGSGSDGSSSGSDPTKDPLGTLADPLTGGRPGD